MEELVLIAVISVQSFLILWGYLHYQETLKEMEIINYYIRLLDYNNLSLEIFTREEAPSLEEEAMLHTMELNLKEEADSLGLQIHFPQRPDGHDHPH